MGLYKGAERLMGMNDATWLRHANPWSAWTRFSALPLLVLAIWSRVWLGWWCLLPIALAVAWIWINPRAFSAPSDFGAWASRAVLGERIFLARDRFEIARQHITVAHMLTLVSALGAIILIWGLVVLDLGLTVAGLVLVIGGKTWFCDRMVWIHTEETKIPLGAAMPEPIWERKVQ